VKRSTFLEDLIVDYFSGSAECRGILRLAGRAGRVVSVVNAFNPLRAVAFDLIECVMSWMQLQV
jgi:hypothetical protein